MNTPVLIALAIILFMILLYILNPYRNVRHIRKHNRPIIEDVNASRLLKVKTIPFDGLPNGEIYDTVEQVSSASKCAAICNDDATCDSWTWSVDKMCDKRRNNSANDSYVYWKTKDAMLKVPGKSLQTGLLKEKLVSSGDDCAKTCSSDGSCSVSQYDESTKTCSYGSVLAPGDTLSGIIPKRRTLIDLAGSQ